MIILDIEASGLDQASYPIEIAWQHRSDPMLFDCFLIEPAEGWIYWDAHAEAHLHRLSRLQLATEGIPVAEAAQRLNQRLNGRTVYTDVHDYDRGWIARLFLAAGIDRTFTVRSLMSLIPPAKVGAYQQQVALKPRSHRALDDVRQMIKSLNYVCPEGC